MKSSLGFSGKLTVRKISMKKVSLSWRLKNWLTWNYIWNLITTKLAILFSKITGIVVMTGKLSAIHIDKEGTRTNMGVISRGLVTTAFVEYMVDILIAEVAAWGDFKFHDSGVGTTAAAIGDTDIETTDGEARATGSQVEGASANIYKSIGTINYTSTKAITEHGLFNIAAAGILMDRHVFAAKNVISGEAIEFTYELTCTAGG